MATEYYHDEAALEKSIAKGTVKTYTGKNGGMWCAYQYEKAVERTGWKEGTRGQGTKRQVFNMLWHELSSSCSEHWTAPYM